MLDIKFVRENPEKVKEAVKSRNGDLDTFIDKLLYTDERRRGLISTVEKMKAKQNTVSKEIPKLKKSGSDVSEIMREMKELSDKISGYNTDINMLEKKQLEMLLSIPNVPNESVPKGKTTQKIWK